jgi:hypothetical protein
LKAGYFYENPLFGDDLFHRRFVFIHHLFCNTNIDGIHCIDFCFKFAGSECRKQCSLISVTRFQQGTSISIQRRVNAAGVPSFTTLQKVTVAVRMLSYGGPGDHLDEYICMGESTILECVRKFTRTMVQEYGDIYLRELNADVIARLLEVAEERGFPGMLGSGRSALRLCTISLEATTRNLPLFLRH